MEETETALFLSDAIFHLQYLGLGGLFNRTIRILKCRSTKHGENVYPFVFTKGNGITIFLPESDKLLDIKPLQYSSVFDEYINKIKKLPENTQKGMILKRLETMKGQWTYNETPKLILDELSKLI